jgi:hypothetical protein
MDWPVGNKETKKVCKSELGMVLNHLWGSQEHPEFEASLGKKVSDTVAWKQDKNKKGLEVLLKR